MKKMRRNRRKNNMNPTKIGVIFIVSALALAGVGVGYSAWTDTITITGTVSTGSVDWTLIWVSGTWVYKVPGVEDEIVIQRQGELQPGDRPTPPAGFIPRDATEDCMAYGEAYDFSDDTLYIKWDNLFPSVYFYIDFLWHYTGSIPVKISDIEFIPDPGNDPEIGDIYDGAIMVRADENGDPIDVYGYPINPGVDPTEVIIGYPDLIQIVDECTQLHNCDYVYGVASLYVPQDPLYMDLNGAGTLTIELKQWNEVDCGGGPCDLSKTYTLDADFDEGTLVGVQYETVHDQLQLSSEFTTLPFIWVPNSNEGTVSKYDTVTGNELGRYWAGPTGGGDPSRTTVDLEGNCWVGNRATGTVVKIGLFEAGNWVDKNGNTVPDTSTDVDSSGDVTGSEILPWNTDECLLFETYVGGGPRGLAVDANNDLWVGTLSLAGGNKFFHIDGDTGLIIPADTINLLGTGYNYRSYGAVIDGNGNIWSSSFSNYVLKINPVTKAITKVTLSITSYGVGIDNAGHLFVTSWGGSQIAKIDVTTLAVTYGNQQCGSGRGVTVTSDGDVWVIDTLGTAVHRFDNNLVYKTTIDIGSSSFSTGVAVDAAGKVWTCNYGDGYIHRIDTTIGPGGYGAIDLSKHTPGYTGAAGTHGMHYSYSDMTGIIARTVTTQLGTWEVIYDAGVPADFSMVIWTDFVPADTSITVEVASSPDGTAGSWSSWETATNGGALSVPNGQYLKVKVTFQIISGDVSPILYDLTIHATCAT